MKRSYFLISVSIGTLVYVLVNLFFGSTGLWAEAQLIKQRNKLAQNVTEVKKINDELSLEYTSLLKDNDVIASYARKLGFVREGEHIVRFTNGIKMNEKVYSAGSYYECESIQFIPEWICKVLGLSVFFLCMILSLLLYLDDKNLIGQNKNQDKIQTTVIDNEEKSENT